MTWRWGLLAAAALLWPDHVTSWFDGAPLDRPAEAIVVAVLFPALWALDPSFLKTRFAHISIAVLLAWRVFSSVALVQEGFCVRFQPARPYTVSQTGAPHAWDVRADWRSPDPACSAIMTRPYTELSEFPAWFFNLPPVGADTPLVAEDRPPAAVTAMTVNGFVRPTHAGLLHVESANQPVMIRIDGGPESDAPRLNPGPHGVTMTTTLSGDRWRFEPLWNGGPPWSALLPTIRRGNPLDVVARRWLRWLPSLVILAFVTGWIASLVRRVADLPPLVSSAGASFALAMLVFTGRLDEARWAVGALTLVALVPAAERNRTMRGAAMAVGIPWLAYVCARALPSIGRFTLYEWGNDFWTFQRYAYRIALQGFWLEGGSATFWFQPLYRWVVAVLHLVFGDSSAGEILWDGGCLLAGALWTYEVVRTRARFGWSVAAAALSLALFILGTPRDLIGRGLGEITSAGFIYVAAALAMRGRTSGAGALAAAGLFAILGFYTRLNNLPMALAVAAFAIPPDVRTRDAIHPRSWLPQVSFATVAVVPAALAVGALLFAARTWYYTGIFSVFYGTQREHLALWPAGAPLSTVAAGMADSLLMVLTVNDPPRWDPFAIPVLCGAAAGVAAVCGVARLRNIPLSVVLFGIGSVAGALVARGSAYPGRFSIHVLPVTAAAFALGAATLAPALAEPSDARQEQPAEEPRLAETIG
jgi:hypothetical protein